MGNKQSSLRDKRHILGGTFEPDVEFGTYASMVNSGLVTNAATYKKMLLIKYADYPEIVTRIRNLSDGRVFQSASQSMPTSFHGSGDTLM